MYLDGVDNSFFDKSLCSVQANDVVPTYIRIFQINILHSSTDTKSTVILYKIISNLWTVEQSSCCSMETRDVTVLLSDNRRPISSTSECWRTEGTFTTTRRWCGVSVIQKYRLTYLPIKHRWIVSIRSIQCNVTKLSVKSFQHNETNTVSASLVCQFPVTAVHINNSSLTSN